MKTPKSLGNAELCCSAQGTCNCYTSISEGADRNSCLDPTRRLFKIFCSAQRVKMIPTSRGTEQSNPISAQSRPEMRILLHSQPSVRGRAACNTNPTDFIAHDLFRSGLSVPWALSAAQGSVTAPQEWKDFYHEHNYSMLTPVLRQKPWDQGMLHEKFDLYHQYFVSFSLNY